MANKTVSKEIQNAPEHTEAATSEEREPDGPRFSLGALYITPGARDALSPEEVFVALSRHVCGDWGDLCREDWAENEHALAAGEGRLFSRYPAARGGEAFYVITEADWMMTTVLLPREY